MDLPKNQFKAGLQASTTQIGLWSTLRSNLIAEIIGGSAFDWVVLDTEHSPNELPDVIAQLQALGDGVSTIVRPAWNDAVLIKRILDAGAQSLVIPFVQSAEEAAAAVAATRYPPQGIRGAMGSGRAAGYGRNKSYLQHAADEIAVVVQVETQKGLDNIKEIAAVDGVDAVFIGPSDLSTSMGYLGNPGHEVVQEAIKHAVDTLTAMNKPAGILAFNYDDASRYINWGYKFVGVGSDVSILVRGLDGLVAQYKD